MSKATGSGLRSTITVTDMFCGAGGSSQGMSNVDDVEIFQAMNHWELAVETHNTNFPNTLHDVADISQVDPRRYHTTTFLWASPECTNHSVAKGSRRRDSQLRLLGNDPDDPSAIRSRATMWDPVRFAEYHNYPFVIIENVVDARKWRLFDSWIHAWQNLGYDFKIVYLNSMFAHLRPLADPRQDQYVPQSRDRMYVVLWKRGNLPPDLEIRPLAYCPQCEAHVEAVQSWKNPRFPWGRYRNQYVYRCPTCAEEVQPYHYAAFNAIDWSIPAPRIGDRKRPLRERTLKRIRAGLEKFGGQHLIIDLAFVNDKLRAYPIISCVSPTQTSWQTQALVSPFVLGYANGDGPAKGLVEALRTVHTSNGQALIIPPMLTSTNYYDDRNLTLDRAAGTQTTQTKWALTTPPFIVLHYSPGYSKGVNESLGSVTTQDHHSLIMPSAFLSSFYSGSDVNHGVDESARTITSKDRHALVAIDKAPTIDDCGFRMLQPHEIGAAMAFGSDYVVLGNARDQVRQYGNAVTPPVPTLLTERCLATLQ